MAKWDEAVLQDVQLPELSASSSALADASVVLSVQEGAEGLGGEIPIHFAPQNPWNDTIPPENASKQWVRSAGICPSTDVSGTNPDEFPGLFGSSHRPAVGVANPSLEGMRVRGCEHDPSVANEQSKPPIGDYLIKRGE